MVGKEKDITEELQSLIAHKDGAVMHIACKAQLEIERLRAALVQLRCGERAENLQMAAKAYEIALGQERGSNVWPNAQLHDKYLESKE